MKRLPEREFHIPPAPGLGEFLSEQKRREVSQRIAALVDAAVDSLEAMLEAKNAAARVKAIMLVLQLSGFMRTEQASDVSDKVLRAIALARQAGYIKGEDHAAKERVESQDDRGEHPPVDA